MSISVLIVDDHSIVRKGIIMFLQTEPSVEIIGEAEDGEDAIRQVGISIVVVVNRRARVGGVVAVDLKRAGKPDRQPDKPIEPLHGAPVGSREQQVGAGLLSVTVTIPEYLTQMMGRVSARRSIGDGAG